MRRSIFIIPLLLFCVATAGRAQESPLLVAPNLIQAHSEALSIDALQKLAEAGDPNAQVQLGILYASGQGGLSGGDVEATKWFKQAAEGGHPFGLFVLSIAHAGGLGGLSGDEAQALKYLRMAADKGLAAAQHQLGDKYANGEWGLGKNVVEAAKWYEKAAGQGIVPAQAELARIYLFKLRNIAGGMKWLRIAAEKGHPVSQLMLSEFYTAGVFDLQKDLAEAGKWHDRAMAHDSQEIQFYMATRNANGWPGGAKNAAESIKWYIKFAENKEGPYVLNLNFIHMFTRAGTPDEAEAVRWLAEKADGGNAWARLILGELYMRGSAGLPWDEAAAEKLFRSAAEQGMPQAQFALGNMYVLGQGGLRADASGAMKWFLKAAEQNHPPAQAALGVRYRFAIRNDAEAVKWFVKAANNGDASGQVGLGDMYKSGRGGLPKDPVEARKWYKRAADQGSLTGDTKLLEMD